MVFATITLLGSEEVLVGIAAIVYWCFDKPRGRFVTYVLLLGAYLNLFLKLLIPWPRPPVNLRIVEKDETSYGFPSGHAQDSTTFWAWISLDFRKRILGIVGVVIVAAVGMSRIYLGLHYPAQVIGGWVIGLAVAGIGMRIAQHLPSRSERISKMPQALFAFATLAPAVVAVALGGAGDVNPARIGGYLFGFSLGALAEDRYVRFTTKISHPQRAIRVVVGGAIAGFLVLVLGRVAPDAYLIPSFANSVVLGLTVALIAPSLFTAIERNRNRKNPQ